MIGILLVLLVAMAASFRCMCRGIRSPLATGTSEKQRDCETPGLVSSYATRTGTAESPSSGLHPPYLNILVLYIEASMQNFVHDDNYEHDASSRCL